MRRIYGDAGDIPRLHLAVTAAAEFQSESLQMLCEYFLRRYRMQTAQGKGKRGLLKSQWRSAEPHFSFAKELDLLEWRERERWRISFGPGRAFLKLWDAQKQPQHFLINQLLQYDRSFTIPFITRLVETDYDFSSGKFVGLEEKVMEVWEEIWASNRRELELLEPKLPSPGEVRPRTLLHHASARIRFLNRIEGLSLNIEKIRRLATNFQGTDTTETMPWDSFFRIGEALNGRRPQPISSAILADQILEAFHGLQRAGYASAIGLYIIVNEASLPDSAVDWNTFSSYLRKERPFSTRTSFRPDDLLVTVDYRTIPARS